MTIRYTAICRDNCQLMQAIIWINHIQDYVINVGVDSSVKPFTNTSTQWGRVLHICVSNLTIIGSDNGLSHGQWQAIIWTNFNEIFIRIQTFPFGKMLLKINPYYNKKCCCIWTIEHPSSEKSNGLPTSRHILCQSMHMYTKAVGFVGYIR